MPGSAVATTGRRLQYRQRVGTPWIKRRLRRGKSGKKIAQQAGGEVLLYGSLIHPAALHPTGPTIRISGTLGFGRLKVSHARRRGNYFHATATTTAAAESVPA